MVLCQKCPRSEYPHSNYHHDHPTIHYAFIIIHYDYPNNTLCIRVLHNISIAFYVCCSLVLSCIAYVLLYITLLYCDLVLHCIFFIVFFGFIVIYSFSFNAMHALFCVHCIECILLQELNYIH